MQGSSPGGSRVDEAEGGPGAAPGREAAPSRRILTREEFEEDRETRSIPEDRDYHQYLRRHLGRARHAPAAGPAAARQGPAEPPEAPPARRIGPRRALMLGLGLAAAMGAAASIARDGARDRLQEAQAVLSALTFGDPIDLADAAGSMPEVAPAEKGPLRVLTSAVILRYPVDLAVVVQDWLDAGGACRPYMFMTPAEYREFRDFWRRRAGDRPPMLFVSLIQTDGVRRELPPRVLNGQSDMGDAFVSVIGFLAESLQQEPLALGPDGRWRNLPRGPMGGPKSAVLEPIATGDPLADLAAGGDRPGGAASPP